MVVVWIEIERVSSKPIETDRDSSQTKRLISKNIFIYTINQFQSNCWQCTDWKYGIFPHVVLFRCEASFAIPIQFDRFITITWHMNKRMDWRTRLIIRWDGWIDLIFHTFARRMCFAHASTVKIRDFYHHLIQFSFTNELLTFFPLGVHRQRRIEIAVCRRCRTICWGYFVIYHKTTFP